MKLNMTLTELVEALKAADGPDRELDDRIWMWANRMALVGIAGKVSKGWEYDLRDAMPYTASLDAALSLLPIIGEEPEMPDYRADYVLEHVNGGMTIGARVAHADADRTAWGANAAIALARGALEAHRDLAPKAGTTGPSRVPGGQTNA